MVEDHIVNSTQFFVINRIIWISDVFRSIREAIVSQHSHVAIIFLPENFPALALLDVTARARVYSDFSFAIAPAKISPGLRLGLCFMDSPAKKTGNHL